MKKVVLLALLTMMCASSFAQGLESYLTEQEHAWNDDTRDAAYLAPNSKFVGKKWYFREGSYFLFNPNGTFKFVERKSTSDYGDVVNRFYWTEHFTGTWKRSKDHLTINWNTKLTVCRADETSLKNFPLRKQDQIRKDLASRQNAIRQAHYTPSEYIFYKLEDDIMILFSKDDFDRIYYFTEGKINELIEKRKQ